MKAARWDEPKGASVACSTAASLVGHLGDCWAAATARTTDGYWAAWSAGGSEHWMGNDSDACWADEMVALMADATAGLKAS